MTIKADGLAENQLAIRQATKKGFAIAEIGDSVNFSVPNSKTRRGRVGKQIANTIDTGCQQGIVRDNLRIQRFTPREAWRLQGFPDWAYKRAANVTSENQLYRLAGNSVTVNLIYDFARRFPMD